MSLRELLVRAKRTVSRTYGGYRAAVGWLSTGGGAISAATLFIVMLIITYDTLMRYVFDKPTQWVFDTATYLTALLAFAVLAYVLDKGRHIRVTVLISRLSPRAKNWLYLVNSCLSVIFCLILIKVSWDLAAASYRMNERPDMSALLFPVFIVKMIIPIGVALFGLRFVIDIVTYIDALRSQPQ